MFTKDTPTETDKIITAKDAYLKATLHNKSILTDLLDNVYGSIQHAVDNGKFEVSISSDEFAGLFEFTPGVILHLMENGFEAKSLSDMRNGTVLSIKWGDVKDV